jgi:hypothetical protein
MEGNTIHAQRKINPHAHPRRPQGNWHTSLGRRRQSSARQRPHAEAAEERGVGLTEIARAPADHVRRDKWLTQRPRRNAVVGLTEIARAPATMFGAINGSRRGRGGTRWWDCGHRSGASDHVRRDKGLTQRPRGTRRWATTESHRRHRPRPVTRMPYAEDAAA